MSIVEMTAPYYRTREIETPNYETYWQDATDPDGVKRDRTTTQERDQYLEDIAQEIQFVRGLRPTSRTLLDVGCGLGWFLYGVGDGWEKHGVEPCFDAATRARESVADAKIQPMMLSGAMLLDDHFDVVFCHHVIEHVQQALPEWLTRGSGGGPENFLFTIRNAMKHGGHLIISTPDFDSPCARRFGDNYRMLHDKTHCSLFTNESMYRFLRDFGFTVDRVEYPFPKRYATAETMERWKDTSKVSPPWPGNWMTAYCRKD